MHWTNNDNTWYILFNNVSKEYVLYYLKNNSSIYMLYILDLGPQ